MITFDTHELDTLARDLGQAGYRATGVMTKVFEEGAERLTQTWQANARQSSGSHGRLYPESIDSERVISTDIVIEIGPNPSKPQGKMAFETGSENQPPHPDGQRAADTQSSWLYGAVGHAIDDLGL